MGPNKARGATGAQTAAAGSESEGGEDAAIENGTVLRRRRHRRRLRIRKGERARLGRLQRIYCEGNGGRFRRLSRIKSETSRAASSIGRRSFDSRSLGDGRRRKRELHRIVTSFAAAVFLAATFDKISTFTRRLSIRETSRG